MSSAFNFTFLRLKAGGGFSVDFHSQSVPLSLSLSLSLSPSSVLLHYPPTARPGEAKSRAPWKGRRNGNWKNKKEKKKERIERKSLD
jgi:hypothetical protein